MNRYQIIKKTDQGVFRVTANDLVTVDQIVEDQKKRPETIYVIVKDRVKNTTVKVWQRDRDVAIEWWIRDL
jgi:hypothetical protein